MTDTRPRKVLTIPLRREPSTTDPEKSYQISVVGYVICSCMSAANPPPGQRRYGQCKHTDAVEAQYEERTARREALVKKLNELREELRTLDGGDRA